MWIRHGRLRAKGWSEEEIAHAHRVVARAEVGKHPAHAFLEMAVFWGLLVVTAASMIAVSLGLVPLLLVFDTLLVIPLLAMLGFCLGTLFSVVIQDIEWLEAHHHGLATLVLGTLAVANLWLVTNGLNAAEARLGFGEAHYPLLLGAVFATTVIAPYAWHLIQRGRER